jgi:hypothetical protein
MGAIDTTVSRETQTLINDADANARTDQERTVVNLLKDLFSLQLSINRNWRQEATFGSRETADRAYTHEPTKTMLASKVLCSGSLDSALRNRLYTGSMQGCSDLSDHGLNVP